MKGTSNIIASIHHLKITAEHWQSFQREHPASKGANLFGTYCKRIQWIINDMVTHPLLPQTVRDGIKAEWNADVFAVDAIAEKVTLLNPEQREVLELIVEQLLKGESIKAEHV